MRYVPGLDGLRALAALAVLYRHTNAPYGHGYFIGVDVFFVLSGYLITRLLDETRPSLRDFYVRRLRRLTPPLFLLLAAYLIVAPIVQPDHPHVMEAGMAALYLSDYGYWLTGMPENLTHTWSLSVEEHFYLLWPLIFYRFRPTAKALLWGFVAATLWRCVQDGWGNWYFRLDTHMSGLILGCLLAQFPRDRFPAWPGLALLAFFGFYMYQRDFMTQGLGVTSVELAAAIAILGKSPAWLEHKALVYLGKLSYGIYLWHFPITLLLKKLPWWEGLPITLVASIALAALSYHTIEATFRGGLRTARRVPEV